MKTIKYLFVGALLVLFSAPAMAQDEEQAIIDNITRVIKNNKGGNFETIEDEVDRVRKKNKKKPRVLVAMGTAFKEINDTTHAREFAEFALDRDSHYAPAHMLLGDLAAIGDDGGRAAEYYQKAINDDPQNPEAYYKYAKVYRKVSPKLAVAKLEELRAVRPDVPVDAMQARFWHDDKEFEKALETYKKVPLHKLELDDLTSFATEHYFTNRHEEGMNLIDQVIDRYPRHAPFNRLGMFFNYEMGNHDKALDFADRLFNKSDSAKISWMDNFYYGLTLQKKGDIDAALAQYHEANAKEVPANNRTSLIQSIYQAYSSKGDFDNAIKYYNQYLEAKGSRTASDYNSLASMYKKHADEVPETEKLQWLQKADEVYAEAAVKFASAEEFFLVQRGRLNATIDADMSKGLAKPHYERASQILEAKADRDDAETKRLIECYRYLGWYYNEQANKEQCQNYWRKVKALDPSNTEADQFLQ